MVTMHDHLPGPTSPPDNVEVTVMSSTSINVTWDEVPSIDQNGLIVEYEVQNIPQETFGGVIEVEMFNTTDLFYVLDDLEEFVSYTISVRAYTIVGPGPYSDPITNQTFQDGRLLVSEVKLHVTIDKRDVTHVLRVSPCRHSLYFS